MARQLFAALLVLSIVSSALAAKPNNDDTASDAKIVAAGNDQFATDLYARLRSGKSSNLFFSPYSISTALAMTDAGAKGETEKQMSQVLHFSLPLDKLHPAFSALRQSLIPKDKTPGYQLRVANRLWGQQGFHFLPTYLQVTKDDYGAELGLVDFKQQTESARTTINSWVEQQTENKIKDLLAPGVLNAETRLVLTNAIYFKATWQYKFEKTATVDANFNVSTTKEVSVPMMHQTTQLSYAENDDVQFLEMPYGVGKPAMVILLPKKTEGLEALEKEVTSENVQKWTGSLKPRLVKVSLPKFKMTSQFSLKDVLESMGMTLAFSNKADFTGMSTVEPLSISAVIHQAFVDVDEEGTEAAASTAVPVKAKSASISKPEEPVEFRADHPFVYMLRDRQTGSILFLGRMVNPKE